MARITAGELRHRMTIQAPVETRSAAGDSVPAWTTIATVWASVRAISGREFWAGSQVYAEASMEVRIRYRADVRSSWRLAWDERTGTRYLDILGVLDPDGRRADLVLPCREVV